MKVGSRRLAPPAPSAHERAVLESAKGLEAFFTRFWLSPPDYTKEPLSNEGFQVHITLHPQHEGLRVITIRLPGEAALCLQEHRLSLWELGNHALPQRTGFLFRSPDTLQTVVEKPPNGLIHGLSLESPRVLCPMIRVPESHVMEKNLGSIKPSHLGLHLHEYLRFQSGDVMCVEEFVSHLLKATSLLIQARRAQGEKLYALVPAWIRALVPNNALAREAVLHFHNVAELARFQRENR